MGSPSVYSSCDDEEGDLSVNPSRYIKCLALAAVVLR